MRYAGRPYKERIALEADDLINDIRSGKVQVPVDDYDYGPELARQEAIASALGVGRGDAERIRNWDLLHGGTDTAYEARTGAELQGMGKRGIDGDYKSDSTIRVHRNNLDMDDPLLDRSVSNRSMIDGYAGVETEYFSPETHREMYREWEGQQRADDAAAGRRTSQANVNNYNRAIAEYYGQQALKLAGNKPVADSNRSYNIVRDAGRNPNTTLGTDRLIETNASIIGGDVGRPAADYRYQRPDGSIGVGDMQVATYDTGENPGRATVRLQALKGSRMSPEQEQRFAGNIRRAAAGVGDIDRALEIMVQRGELPQLSRGEVKRYVPGPDGMRAGKMLSDAPFMGQQNFNDQHRYQHVLYALQDQARQMGNRGAVPTAYVDVNAARAREFMNDNADRLKLMATIGGKDGSAVIHSDVNELLRAGVATNMADAYPAVRQLL